MEFPKRSNYKSYYQYQLALREWRCWKGRRIEFLERKDAVNNVIKSVKVLTNGV